MLDSPGVNELRLRFLDSPQPDLDLGIGVHALSVDGEGRLSAAGGGQRLLGLHRDRRGLWLTVEPGAHGVHLNGRPVRRLALVRAGDRLHAAGQALQLQGTIEAARAGSTGQPPAEAARLLLRGLGGLHHGRAYPLGRDLRIGGGDADIAIEGAPAPLAGVRAREGVVIAEALDRNAPLEVNGHQVASASLQPGDQLLVAGQRLLLEAPSARLASLRAAAPQPIEPAETPAGNQAHARAWRMPWLLLAAALLAAALAALLLFGG